MKASVDNEDFLVLVANVIDTTSLPGPRGLHVQLIEWDQFQKQNASTVYFYLRTVAPSLSFVIYLRK